jgi:hypothetical protein
MRGYRRAPAVQCFVPSYTLDIKGDTNVSNKCPAEGTNNVTKGTICVPQVLQKCYPEGTQGLTLRIRLRPHTSMCGSCRPKIMSSSVPFAANSGVRWHVSHCPEHNRSNKFQTYVSSMGSKRGEQYVIKHGEQTRSDMFQTYFSKFIHGNTCCDVLTLYTNRQERLNDARHCQTLTGLK